MVNEWPTHFAVVGDGGAGGACGMRKINVSVPSQYVTFKTHISFLQQYIFAIDSIGTLQSILCLHTNNGVGLVINARAGVIVLIRMI